MDDKKDLPTEGKSPKPEEKKAGDEKGDKTLTQEQFDKVLAKRLSEETQKITKKAEAEIKEAREEAERLAKLSAEEKEKELQLKTQKELDNKMAEVSRRENRLDAIEKFTEAKVPTELVGYILSDDKEKTLQDAEDFVKAYNKSVSDSVTERLKGTPPKDITDNSKNGTTPKVVTSF